MPQNTIIELSPDVKRCLRTCLDCYESCVQTAAHGLKMGGRHGTAHPIMLLEDCAGVCRLHAEYLMRSSPRQAELAAVCARVCRECADECRKMDDDRVMKECADICVRCAESCKQMTQFQ